MSGSLGSLLSPGVIAGAGTAALALGDIAFALATGAVSVGAFITSGFEIPEQLPFGGSQEIKEHKLIGGARVLDVMGADEDDISWKGYFQGSGALSRATLVDTQRSLGLQLPLVWPGGGRLVVISKFKCTIERGGYFCPYEITCKVIPLLNLAAVAGQLGSLATSLGSDVGSAIGITGGMFP